MFFQEVNEGFDFSAADGEYSFGIFSVKFSTDGWELVAGSSDDSIYVYDIETNKLSLRFVAHMVGSLSVYSWFDKNFLMSILLHESCWILSIPVL